MRFYIASVTHKYGVSYYCGLTQKELDTALADYCREYWEGEGIPGSPTGDDVQDIETYFSEMRERGEETYDTGDYSFPGVLVQDNDRILFSSGYKSSGAVPVGTYIAKVFDEPGAIPSIRGNKITRRPMDAGQDGIIVLEVHRG